MLPQVQRFESARSRGPRYWREAAVGVLLLGAVLAVGSVHVLTAITVAVASGALASLLLWDSEVPRTALLPAAAALALGLYSAMQALPIPQSVVSLIAPASAAIWERSLEPLGGAPAFITLSLDPGASLVEGAKWVGYAAILVACAVIARRRGATPVLAMVVAVGLCCALLACGHLAVGATHLYGIYEPKLAVTPWKVAPLLNPNNLAGYLNFAAFVGFGLMLSRRPLLHPALMALALAFLLAISLLTGSRGAVVSLLLGLILLVWAIRRSRVSRSSSFRALAARYAPIALVVAVALGFALLGSQRDTSLGFSQQSIEKLSIARWAAPMILDHPWFGVGRGAFETVFPAYREGLGRMMYQYPENLAVQWLSEWGLVPGLVALGVFAWCLLPRRLKLADDIRARSAHIALLVLILHNLVDLSLEISGVATSFFAVFGTLCGAADRVRETDSEYAVRRSDFAWIPAGSVSVFAGLALLFGRHAALPERMALHAAYEAVDTTRVDSMNGLMQRVTDAIRRRPADPYLPYLAGLLQARLGKDPIPWFNRAIERDPKRGLPYYMLSRLLFPRGMLDQAWLHARLAVELQPELSRSLAPIAITHTTKLEHLLNGIPPGAPGLTFLLSLARAAKRHGKGEITEKSVLNLATKRYPNASGPLLLEANLLADALDRAESECTQEVRVQCIERLAKNLAALERDDPTSLETVLLRARYLVAVDRAAEAADLLDRRCAELQGTLGCWHARVRAAVKSRDAARIETASAGYLAMACESSKPCGKAILHVGDLLAQENDWVGAMKYYGKATREHPTRAAWTRLSRAAKEAGHTQRAQEANRRSERAAVDVD